MFVYLITNTINGKRYVGQTTASLEQRLRQHKKLKGCRAIHGAIEKYGESNFIIEAIVEPPTKELMDEFEAEYIQKYCTLVPNGYNLTEGGSVPRHNAETKARMSASHKGTFTGRRLSWTSEERSAARERSLGSRNPRSKLTNEQVNEIRSLYAAGKHALKEIAVVYSVYFSTIGKIVRNERYKF